MLKRILLTIVLLGLGAAEIAQGAVSPVSLSIIPPVQFPPSSFSVTGARVSLLGRHRDLYGVDLAVIGNITDQSFVGIAAAGGFNSTNGQSTILGLQLAGVTNLNHNKINVYGLQAAGLMNYNKAASKVVGLQVAPLANMAMHTDVYGAQIGLYNRAKTVYGFQIGLINVADSLRGVQIGLANFHHKGLFVVSPIINIGF